ncbi:MAG: hypothetical protein GFH27_549279n136 [Chloroflexi bacterium AL-W]|nr:hypothetical protein [Chloroflexi bacterium AL-N1]NOK65102.1 hypothetical protein [Chloroflexi bacterium AL-N10]NOK72631.1 hypothetical protein [Chloroflexi bacterium AL-N5]NOK79281.1 hypothetical protein [Chloroflexi bacterium AL-W]NOK87197.1 hypothetical protein [Chloroflexi bacterium AL-N15]
MQAAKQKNTKMPEGAWLARPPQTREERRRRYWNYNTYYHFVYTVSRQNYANNMEIKETPKCLRGPGLPDPPKQEKRGEGDIGIISYL